MLAACQCLPIHTSLITTVPRDAQDVQARPSASAAAFTTSSPFLAFDLSGLDAFDTFSSGDSH